MRAVKVGNTRNVQFMEPKPAQTSVHSIFYERVVHLFYVDKKIDAISDLLSTMDEGQEHLDRAEENT